MRCPAVLETASIINSLGHLLRGLSICGIKCLSEIHAIDSMVYCCFVRTQKHLANICTFRVLHFQEIFTVLFLERKFSYIQVGPKLVILPPPSHFLILQAHITMASKRTFKWINVRNAQQQVEFVSGICKLHMNFKGINIMITLKQRAN